MIQATDSSRCENPAGQVPYRVSDLGQLLIPRPPSLRTYPVLEYALFMIMSPLAPGISLVGISRDQAKIRGLIAVICLLPLLALLIVSIALWDLLWVTIAVAVALVIGLFIMFVQVRAVFYTGYHETDEELLVCRGILFRKLDVVPYGRMQEVTVEDGPLMRHYGLAKITMETASSTTDTSIPGVRRDEADRLRRRLTELGSTKMEGL